MGTMHRSGWSSIGCFLVLSAAAQAQQVFITSTVCGPLVPVISQSLDAQESLLFEGTAVQFDANGTPYVGSMLFAVNQETGTWSMFVIYEDGTTCEISIGADFAPISHN